MKDLMKKYLNTFSVSGREGLLAEKIGKRPASVCGQRGHRYDGQPDRAEKGQKQRKKS